MDDLINVYPGRDAALFVPGASDSTYKENWLVGLG